MTFFAVTLVALAFFALALVAVTFDVGVFLAVTAVVGTLRAGADLAPDSFLVRVPPRRPAAALTCDDVRRRTASRAAATAPRTRPPAFVASVPWSAMSAPSPASAS